MRRQNRVEQVVTTDYNPENEGYETTVINTCSKNRKSLPQLAEACVSYMLEESSWISESEIPYEYTQRRSKGCGSGVTITGVKLEKLVMSLSLTHEKLWSESLVFYFGRCPDWFSRRSVKARNSQDQLTSARRIIRRFVRGVLHKGTCRQVNCHMYQEYTSVRRRDVLVIVAVQSDTQVSSAQEHQGVNQGCVESLSSSDGWMASPVWSNIGTKVFKDFDSMLNAHEWNQKVKEEINLQKDVQISVQALEQDRESDDLVNHIGCVFRYFIVDVVDLVSTPDVAVQP
ncbi:hypothetical protein F2Q69_00016333 [Brassica cretica]|uniref:Uncharacterized protein n=1 Tax=Brassica cretica TaxID=69181 RepID=A0A8S9QR47_BRACR|nr:hypothetical protein F2Q69_00016333 [Brassica cretica]